MARLEQEIAERLRPFEDVVRRLCTVPGIDRVSAWGIISEIGLDMHQFEDAKHLASWAGLCPGKATGRVRANERVEGFAKGALGYDAISANRPGAFPPSRAITSPLSSGG